MWGIDVGPRENPFNKKKRHSLPSVCFRWVKITLGEHEDCDNSLWFLLKTSSALGYNLGVIYLLESVGRKLCSCLLRSIPVAGSILYEGGCHCFSTTTILPSLWIRCHLKVPLPPCTENKFKPSTTTASTAPHASLFSPCDSSTLNCNMFRNLAKLSTTKEALHLYSLCLNCFSPGCSPKKV